MFIRLLEIAILKLFWLTNKKYFNVVWWISVLSGTFPIILEHLRLFPREFPTNCLASLATRICKKVSRKTERNETFFRIFQQFSAFFIYLKRNFLCSRFCHTKLFCVFLNRSFSCSYQLLNFIVVLRKMLLVLFSPTETNGKTVKDWRNFKSNQFKYFYFSFLCFPRLF